MNSNDYIQEDIRIINLYSQSATTYLNGTLKSSVTFNFKNILRDEPDIIYSTIGISSAQIPVSYYTINEYNNVLVTSLGTVYITAGNYSASTLRTELYNKMFPMGFGSGLLVTISPTTGRLRFEDGVSFRFWREYLGVTSTAYDILGFDTNVPYYDSSIPFGGTLQRITAPYLLNLLGIQQLRISSSALACNNSTSTQMGESNLIGVVQSTAPPYGMILYANQTSYSVLRAKNISLIDIQILDEDSNFVDFNNIDWTISLQLTIFRKIPLPSVTAEFLKPILDTLGVIQGELGGQAPSQPAPTSDPASDLLTQENQQQQDLLYNDDNSLDIMSYNKQLPS
jgi:hypothetical protein